MKTKLIKKGDVYFLDELKIDGYFTIANSLAKPNGLMYNLSLKNCQAIEHGYDLDALSRQEAEKIYNKSEHEDYSIWEYLVSQEVDSIKIGFQKAIELMGDKKFSDKDMSKAWSEGYHRRVDEINGNELRYFDEFTQSLQQTEWDVKIEMEYVGECNGNNDNGCFQDSPGHNCGCFERKPKLDENGWLILKRI